MPSTYKPEDDPHYTYFNNIPWCSAQISNPKFKVVPTAARVPKASTEDSLIAETFSTSSTIPAMLTLCSHPIPPSSFSKFSSPSATSSQTSSPSPTTAAEQPQLITEVRTLISLASGMNGYPAILHGGIVATLLDETMGSLLILNKALKNPALTPDFVTLELVTKFKKPVRTPQVVLVVAEIKEVKGRKVFLSARVDDGSGGVLAMGEALFVGLKGKI